MANTTKIAWCDATFNPWLGCTKVSPGCEHCYAEKLVGQRFKRVSWGAGNPRALTRAETWADPHRLNRRAAKTGERLRLFCGSLCDVFDNEVPIHWLVELLDLIRRTPNLAWLLLTKRIGNWRSRLEACVAALRAAESAFDADEIADSAQVKLREWIEAWLNGRAPVSVWLGATVVNQAEADRDIPKLLQVPARVRFLSCEPLLGPLDLRRYLKGAARVDWVIAGGESGSSARIFRPAWARRLRDQCALADVPFFMKQMGRFVVERNDQGFVGDEPSEWPETGYLDVLHDIHGYREEYQGADCRVVLRDAAGANPAEWPEDLRVQDFPAGVA